MDNETAVAKNVNDTYVNDNISLNEVKIKINNNNVKGYIIIIIIIMRCRVCGWFI